MERKSEHLYATIINKKEASLLDGLSSSIISFQPSSEIHALLLGASSTQVKELNNTTEGVTFYSCKAIVPVYMYLVLMIRLLLSSNRAIKGVYKAYFSLFLVRRQRKGVILIDPDLRIKTSIGDVLDQLSTHDVVLFPNGFPLHPKETENGFIKNFKKGFYTSLLVGFSKDADDLLKWWAKVCFYRCRNDKKRSFYYEQTYLNFLPVMFENVKVMPPKYLVITKDNLEYIKDTEKVVIAKSTSI
ncbi:hypothetical protein [Ekhidna sp.]|uniref:hypothetical protein n=1 Tax=Ekhidna sp. TaxID=2608089 RepID=UPI003C7A780C